MLNRLLRATACATALASVAWPAVAGAGIVVRRVVDDGFVCYRDDLEYDDGFQLVEVDGRLRVRRGGRTVTLRLRRPAPARRRAEPRIEVTGRDGRRLEVRRRLRRC